MTTTLNRFAIGLKTRLRNADILIPEGLPYSDVTAGDSAAIDWDELDKAIDEFCTEFQQARIKRSEP